MLKRLLFFILFCVLFTTQSFAQTQLDKGDLVVVGVNVSNANCLSDGNDRIDFITLEPIEQGTNIQITDNRYISDNTFTSNEGFYSFKRVGGRIPAGSSFTIDIINIMSVGTIYNGWELIYKNSTFGLPSNDPDQFFVLQNAEFNSSTGVVSGSNLKYLFAYNTKKEWSTVTNANNSKLPPQINCFYIDNDKNNPTNGTHRKYRYYSGDTTGSLSKTEWIKRILDSSNWDNASTCGNFNSNVFTGSVTISDDTIIEEINLCFGDPFSPLTVTSESSITNYRWFYSSDSINYSQIGSGASMNSLTPLNILGTSYYYCEMTININGSTCPMKIKSKIFKVTVNPKPITSPINKID